MVDTIESFVKKLHSEGVQAGQAAADEVCREAEQKAAQILKRAEAQAEEIIANAKTQADSRMARHQSELEMAARDTVVKLRETLAESLKAVLAGPVEGHLSDSGFLKQLLHDIVMQYARLDSERADEIRINVSPEMHHQLAEWAIGELHRAAQNHSTSIDLKGNLSGAGFEYKFSGATVEVTTNSVVETLSELVGPQLRKVLQESAKENQQ